MTIHVIGAGLGRTGTLSIKAALEELGFGPCYHMYELAAAHLDHAVSWNAANRGDVDALRVPLADYRATVDWPGCVFWRELAELYPEAKVLLSVRPPARWYDSFRQTVGALIAEPSPDDLPDTFKPVAELSDRVVRERTFGTHFDLDDADAVIAAYEAHNDAVRAGVSPDRLLEFDVDEGWEPLCAFLGLPVPSTPFPRKNDIAQFREIFGLDVAMDEEPSFDEGELAALQDRMRAAL
jgi:hypothetical protein